MEPQSRTEPTAVIQASQPAPHAPTPPHQIWGQLSPQQQRGVFQTLVGLCQELLRRHTCGEAEVTHEPG
jgi:hypothetical protein